MEGEETISVKPKRVRKKLTRKWSLAEEKMLIVFLMQNLDVEKPTAQSYYRGFVAETGVAIEWSLVRSKVHNMRVIYNKAKAWEGSTGAGSMNGDTVKNTLHKMCRFFDEFDEVFGSRIIEEDITEETLQSSNRSTEIYDIADIEINETSIVAEGTPMDCEILPSTSRKGIYSRTCGSTESVVITKRYSWQHRCKT